MMDKELFTVLHLVSIT